VTVAGKDLLAGLVGRLVGRGETPPFTVPGVFRAGASVLAIADDDLTDLLFHVPLLRAIRQRYPATHIDVLVPEALSSLVVPSGFARRVMVYGPRQLRPWSPAFFALLKQVRRSGYQTSILMSFGHQGSLEAVSLASGAPLRLGPSHPGSYPAVNFEIRPPRDQRRYRGDRLEAATPFLDLPSLRGLREWPLPEERVRRMRQLVHFNKPRRDELLIAVDPALAKSGHGLTVQNLHFVVNQLSSQLPCRILALSLTAAPERLAEFESGLTTAPLALPRETLFDVVLLASQCDLVVAGNTDLFHFATAMGVPSVGLFLENEGADWVPADRPNARVIRIKPGRRVDIDTLMEAVEGARAGAGS